MLKISRKSFFYKKNFKKGSKIKLNDLVLLRPNKGILPFQLKEIINKKLTKNVKAYCPTKLNHFTK